MTNHNSFQKVQIICDLVCYGPVPQETDPVLQKLTISSSGRIWFSEYVYGTGDLEHPKLNRKIQLSIGKENSQRLLTLLEAYINDDPVQDVVTDVGSWQINAYDNDNNVIHVYGAMLEDVEIDGVDLDQEIRKAIPIEGLRVFKL